ncbi:1383_t:CDS:1, partial [Entrophospora sp. SA101]
LYSHEQDCILSFLSDWEQEFVDNIHDTHFLAVITDKTDCSLKKKSLFSLRMK